MAINNSDTHTHTHIHTHTHTHIYIYIYIICVLIVQSSEFKTHSRKLNIQVSKYNQCSCIMINFSVPYKFKENKTGSVVQ